MTPGEEAQLVEKAKSDPDAFGVLYEHYYSQMFGYVFRRVLNWEVAQDITSEVFLKAYSGIWRFRWTSISIGAWFYRIATNEVNMYFRRGKLSSVSLDELVERGFDLPDPTTTEAEKARVEKELHQYQDFLMIQSRLKELPLKYQEVITLRYFEQKSLREISEILDKKEGTVKSLLARGIDKLEEFL